MSRATLKTKIEDFLASGGKIEKVPFGRSALDAAKILKQQKEIKA